VIGKYNRNNDIRITFKINKMSGISTQLKVMRFFTNSLLKINEELEKIVVIEMLITNTKMKYRLIKSIGVL
jgi:hypothetical protein